jgi:hypothetical protein
LFSLLVFCVVVWISNALKLYANIGKAISLFISVYRDATNNSVVFNLSLLIDKQKLSCLFYQSISVARLSFVLL